MHGHQNSRHAQNTQSSDRSEPAPRTPNQPVFQQWRRKAFHLRYRHRGQQAHPRRVPRQPRPYRRRPLGGGVRAKDGNPLTPLDIRFYPQSQRKHRRGSLTHPAQSRRRVRIEPWSWMAVRRAAQERPRSTDLTPADLRADLHENARPWRYRPAVARPNRLGRDQRDKRPVSRR